MRTRALLFWSLLGAGCSTDDTTSAGGASTARLAPDEYGVRVGGGETSDFGSGTSEPYACRPIETTELAVDEALAAGLPIEGVLGLVAEPFEAPFHWGYRCEDGAASTEGDTTLSMQVEVINITRTIRMPLPDQPPEALCPDTLEYRAVIDLATDDGRIAGRFYGRFNPTFTTDETIVARVTADPRNFSGSLTAPFDLSRPHWSAVEVSFTLHEAGSFGSLDIVVNYTDDETWPEKYGAGGYWPARAHMDERGLLLPADDGTFYRPPFIVFGVPLCVPEPSLPPPGAQTLALDDYRGSVEPPTCVVDASFFAQSEYGGVTAEGFESLPPGEEPIGNGDLDVSVSINGASRVIEYPWSVPHELGRFPVGTSVAVDVSSRSSAVMPFAALNIDGFNTRTGYDRLAFCQPAGCVAHVEDTVAGYCAH